MRMSIPRMPQLHLDDDRAERRRLQLDGQDFRRDALTLRIGDRSPACGGGGLDRGGCGGQQAARLRREQFGERRGQLRRRRENGERSTDSGALALVDASSTRASLDVAPTVETSAGASDASAAADAALDIEGRRLGVDGSCRSSGRPRECAMIKAAFAARRRVLRATRSGERRGDIGEGIKGRRCVSRERATIIARGAIRRPRRHRASSGGSGDDGRCVRRRKGDVSRPRHSVDGDSRGRRCNLRRCASLRLPHRLLRRARLHDDRGAGRFRTAIGDMRLRSPSIRGLRSNGAR